MPLFLSSTFVILEGQYQSHHRGPDVFLFFFHFGCTLQDLSFFIRDQTPAAGSEST